MPRKITPPRYRGGQQIIWPGQGEAPKVARNPNIDPDPVHRCQVCQRMRAGCVCSVYPPEPARWTCPSCLEAAGQMRLEG